MRKKTQATILVVDDDPINVQMLAEGLRHQYQVIVANCGKKALEICLNQSPDLVLLDINLPDMNGYQVCKALKNNALTKQIPIIFITGYDSEESELKGLEMGAADYFSKPFKMPLVMARVAIQVDLKRKTDLLESLVDIDGLTGIPNRRRFDHNLDEEWRRAARRKTNLSLCFIDVDYFKPFNDHYGHAAGDDCLKRVAHELDKNVKRAGDSVARYGGEEFIVLLPAISPLEAKIFAESLRVSVQNLAIKHERSKCAKSVTISIGVATSQPSKTQSKEDLVRVADEQVYIAKSLGRNCVSATEIKA